MYINLCATGIVIVILKTFRRK